MNSSARVTSIDALRRLKVAMEGFEHDSRNAVAAMTLEVRRVLQWIEHDRTQYWPRELRKAYDRVAEARNDLERCMMRAGDENTRACYDEKKALERAKRRVRTCEEKIQAVKFWRRQLRHDAEEFSGTLSKLDSRLDTDWARSLATLQRMVVALEKYAESRQFGESAPAGSASPPVDWAALASSTPESSTAGEPEDGLDTDSP